DEPGVIHDFTEHLLEADINIKDIELQTIREGTGGTFRLAFKDASDAEAAASVLSEAGYEARRP
ncbi:MAG: prephenate dehydrogenase/arogenate dehydrogenase family protein, partial [Bacteroidetes bacterium QH_2_64_26]